MTWQKTNIRCKLLFKFSRLETFLNRNTSWTELPLLTTTVCSMQAWWINNKLASNTILKYPFPQWAWALKASHDECEGLWDKLMNKKEENTLVLLILKLCIPGTSTSSYRWDVSQRKRKEKSLSGWAAHDSKYMQPVTVWCRKKTRTRTI